MFSPAASARQFDAPPTAAAKAGEEKPSTPAPTIEEILAAHRSGKPSAAIVSWVKASHASFHLTLEAVLELRGQGLPIEVISAMSGVPGEKLQRLVGETGRSPATGAASPRTGLSKRQILKMIHEGTPEPEIMRAIGEQGSKASLDLDEALSLQEQGASPALLAAIVTGTAPALPAVPQAGSPEAPPAAAGAPRQAGGPAPPGQAPTLDEILGPEEATEESPTLDEALGEIEPEEEEAEPGPEEAEITMTLEEAIGEEEGAVEPEALRTYLFALSDPSGARLFLAAASARAVDLLKQAKGAGRTPAQIELDPGAWFLLVEKKPDDFDAGLIPAIRTVHDGDGTTRTLIESGDIYYDAQRCCLPRSLAGDLAIARISEDQQGTILGDEFGGLPPYLWDGNRYLILSLREGRIRRAIKVYEIRKAVGESTTVTATFIPTSAADPLAPRAIPAAGAMEEAEAQARESWRAPAPADLDGIAEIYGIPGEDLSKLAPLLTSMGKAIWRQEGDDGSVDLVALSLDSIGGIRVEEYHYRKDGPFGMLSTPAPPAIRKKKGAKPKVEIASPLPDVTRTADPGAFLPVISVSNGTKGAALVRLWNGTAMYVPAGETRDRMVSPGSGEIEARFASKPAEKRRVKAHFTYHARYKLRLD